MMDKTKLFQDGGMMDDSGEVVNGTEVPAGSLRNEVADDIPARLSEGEFVVPADVVRFIGLEKLMKMRDAAKAGLARMQEMGQMGNAQEVQNPDQMFSESMPQEEDTSQFESDIDGIMSEVDQEEMAKGGAVKKYAPGGVVTAEDPVAAANTAIDDPSYSSAPISGFKMVKYYDKNGNIKYIPTINGQPLLIVPAGYTTTPVSNTQEVQEPDEQTEKQSSTLSDNAGVGDGPGVGGDSGGSSSSSSSGNMGIGPTPSTGSVSLVDALAFTALYGPIVGPAKAMMEAAKHNPQNVPVMDAILGLNISNVGETGMGINSEGQTVSNTGTIAAQNAQMFGVNENDPDYGVPAAPGGQGTPSGTQGVNAGLPGFDIGVSDIGSVGDPSSAGSGSSGDASSGAGDDGGGVSAGSSGEDGVAKGGFINHKYMGKKTAKKQTRKGIAAKK